MPHTGDDEASRKEAVRSIRHMVQDLSARDVELVFGLVENMLERAEEPKRLGVAVVDLDEKPKRKQERRGSCSLNRGD